jgi:hypothetical protein
MSLMIGLLIAFLYAVWAGEGSSFLGMFLIALLIGLPLYLLGAVVWFFWQLRENIHPWRK